MSRTLASNVCNQLRAAILECRLQPSAWLRLEELKADYGVGISPLREALMRLVTEGLVVLEEHRGFYVAPVSASKLLDITFMRKKLEAMAFQLSIEKGDDQWESQVVSTFHALAKRPLPAGEIDREWDARHDAFHSALTAACGSDWLQQFRRTLYEQWTRYRRLSMAYLDQPRDILAEHREMMNAALKRDSQAAVYLMQKHIETSTEFLLSVNTDLSDSAPVTAKKRSSQPA